MNQLGSVFLYFSTLGLLTLMGLGPVVTLLGRKLRCYSLVIAPGVGYAIFCFLSIWFSGLTGTPTEIANYWTGAILVTWCLGALWWYRNDIQVIFRAWWLLPALASVSALVLFIPVLHLGVDNYLGTVNPDFFQSLSLHETLLRSHASIWVNRHDLSLGGPFQQMFPDAFQARFGGVVFSVFLEQVSGTASQAALMLAIMAFVSCLPLAVYFFSRVVLEFEERAAILAAVFVVVAAPTGMSFLHTFIGQNSALAMFPLGITLVYLALRERSLGITLLTVLVLNGVFYLYVMALPYIVAPFLFVVLIQTFRQGWATVRFSLLAALVGAAVTFGIHWAVFPTTSRFVNDLFDLLGKLTQSQYYADFLTEEVLQYATGLTSYPLSQNSFFFRISYWAPTVLISTGGVIAFLYFLMLKRWISKASEGAVTAVAAMLVTYMAVWFKYTFTMKYGYASFKMSAWLQFLLVPFIAWGVLEMLARLREGFDSRGQRVFSYFSLFVLGGLFPILNLLSDIDYGIKSYGHDIYHGSIINSYGISGNKEEYSALKQALIEKVPEGKMVAVGFGDSIENFWVSSYLDHAKLKTAVLSHEEIPFEDAHLPDIHSRHYIDSMGNDQVDLRRFYKAADSEAEYYLLPGRGNLNEEIIGKQFNGSPLWENESFRLFDKKDLRDALVTGRGFYRVEHMDAQRLSWWWPKTFRWSAQGGEIYHLHPSKRAAPHRVQFSIITGLGQATGERTIELWHNGKLFDEVGVRGAARIISKPYVPLSDLNLIVLKIKEKSVLVGRGTGLWNRDLPRRATPINALFSDIEIVSSDSPLEPQVPDSRWILPKEQFAKYSQFNGFDVDGWVRDRAEFTVPPIKGITSVSMRLLIPGNLDFKFPNTLKLVVNGETTIKSFEKPGEFEFDIPVPAGSSGSGISVQLIPSQAKRIASGMVQREILQSIRLSAVKFVKAD